MLCACCLDLTSVFYLPLNSLVLKLLVHPYLPYSFVSYLSAAWNAYRYYPEICTNSVSLHILPNKMLCYKFFFLLWSCHFWQPVIMSLLSKLFLLIGFMWSLDNC